MNCTNSLLTLIFILILQELFEVFWILCSEIVKIKSYKVTNILKLRLYASNIEKYCKILKNKQFQFSNLNLPTVNKNATRRRR